MSIRPTPFLNNNNNSVQFSAKMKFIHPSEHNNDKQQFHSAHTNAIVMLNAFNCVSAFDSLKNYSEIVELEKGFHATHTSWCISERARVIFNSIVNAIF